MAKALIYGLIDRIWIQFIYIYKYVYVIIMYM